MRDRRFVAAADGQEAFEKNLEAFRLDHVAGLIEHRASIFNEKHPGCSWRQCGRPLRELALPQGQCPASGVQPIVREIMLSRGLGFLDHTSLGVLRRLSGDGAKRKRCTDGQRGDDFQEN